jgi:hypothetical protein
MVEIADDEFSTVKVYESAIVSCTGQCNARQAMAFEKKKVLPAVFLHCGARESQDSKSLAIRIGATTFLEIDIKEGDYSWKNAKCKNGCNYCK